MPRRVLALLFVAAVAFTLAACGGGGGTTPPNLPSSTTGSGNGNGSSTPTPPPGVNPSPSPTADPCGCITVTEKNTKDDLLGGIAVGSDQNIYASTAKGVDIFNSQLSLLPSPSPIEASRIRETWPTVPKAGTPLGAVAAAGSTINALGTTPGTTGSSAQVASVGIPEPTPSSQPYLAQYSVPLQSWGSPIVGNFGDRWVSLAAAGGTNLFVIGDKLTPKGWVGYLIGIGISCISPVFTHPLGAAAMGPDGNLWVATNPVLNGDKTGTQSDPSVLYAINTSTGAILRTIVLPNGSHVSAIAAGSKALWFTDDGLNAVGQVTMSSNTPTIISLPNNGVDQAPVSISPDSIGRMWFTEFNGKRVGYVVPATLQLTVLKVTTKGAPMGIVGCVQGQTTCPQTNVFFAENIALGAASF